MGNVPGKEERSQGEGTSSGAGGAGGGGNRRRGNTLNTMAVREILNPSAGRKKKSSKEKEAGREQAVRELVVTHEENVDGGFLAPYGVYNGSQDYATDVVRSLIVQRKLAPFYLPLQDYDAGWSEDELLGQLDKLRLHAPINAARAEDTILDPNSKHYQKHLQARLFDKSLLDKRVAWQDDAEKRYAREKKLAYVNGFRKEHVPSRDLLLRLYGNATECPICFLYYPDNLNYTRCCVQPICSECFVQIKRLDPHPPHDEHGNANSLAQTAPKDLISEPAKCPFCAMSSFGVTYSPPPDIRTGLGGIPACDFKSHPVVGPLAPSDSAITVTSDPVESPESTQRRHSLPPEHASVITTDHIRPDWERKLNAARMKLARRSAAATAIHASSLLMNETGNGQARAARTDSNADLEQKMIEEALRLSLLEEEDRQSRQKQTSRD